MQSSKSPPSCMAMTMPPVVPPPPPGFINCKHPAKNESSFSSSTNLKEEHANGMLISRPPSPPRPLPVDKDSEVVPENWSSPLQNRQQQLHLVPPAAGYMGSGCPMGAPNNNSYTLPAGGDCRYTNIEGDSSSTQNFGERTQDIPNSVPPPPPPPPRITSRELSRTEAIDAVDPEASQDYSIVSGTAVPKPGVHSATHVVGTVPQSFAGNIMPHSEPAGVPPPWFKQSHSFQTVPQLQIGLNAQALPRPQRQLSGSVRGIPLPQPQPLYGMVMSSPMNFTSGYASMQTGAVMTLAQNVPVRHPNLHPGLHGFG